MPQIGPVHSVGNKLLIDFKETLNTTAKHENEFRDAFLDMVNSNAILPLATIIYGSEPTLLVLLLN
ncbi:hypothetical protein RJ43_08880 [Alteromonas macleodii]|nr:hypothetical protein RJ43_08880 [Alteromonas macleodii]